jgi:general secretion pathway protein C
MVARLCALVIWVLVALSGASWANRWFAAAPAEPASRTLATPSEPPRSAFARMLGEPPAAAAPVALARAAASRFVLSGVVASIRSEGSGIALIAVDGKRVGAYHVGASVDGDVLLQSVGRRGATLAPANGGPKIVLELPRPTPPATGVPRTAGASPATAAATSGLTPSAATVAPAAGLAAAATAAAPTEATAAEVDPAATPQFVRETQLGVQAPLATPSPGRRQRLRGLGNAPAGTEQAAQPD